MFVRVDSKGSYTYPFLTVGLSWQKWRSWAQNLSYLSYSQYNKLSYFQYKSYSSPAPPNDVKEHILSRSERGMGRDTNPVAHGLVVDRGNGKRQEKRQTRKTKVTNTAQYGNCAAESSAVPPPHTRRLLRLTRRCRNCAAATRLDYSFHSTAGSRDCAPLRG